MSSHTMPLDLFVSMVTTAGGNLKTSRSANIATQMLVSRIEKGEYQVEDVFSALSGKKNQVMNNILYGLADTTSGNFKIAARWLKTNGGKKFETFEKKVASLGHKKMRDVLSELKLEPPQKKKIEKKELDFSFTLKELFNIARLEIRKRNDASSFLAMIAAHVLDNKEVSLEEMLKEARTQSLLITLCVEGSRQDRQDIAVERFTNRVDWLIKNNQKVYNKMLGDYGYEQTRTFLSAVKPNLTFEHYEKYFNLDKIWEVQSARNSGLISFVMDYYEVAETVEEKKSVISRVVGNMEKQRGQGMLFAHDMLKFQKNLECEFFFALAEKSKELFISRKDHFNPLPLCYQSLFNKSGYQKSKERIDLETALSNVFSSMLHNTVSLDILRTVTETMDEKQGMIFFDEKERGHPDFDKRAGIAYDFCLGALTPPHLLTQWKQRIIGEELNHWPIEKIKEILTLRRYSDEETNQVNVWCEQIKLRQGFLQDLPEEKKKRNVL